VEARGLQYLPVLSETSLSDALFLERCGLAAAKDSFVVPCSCVTVPDARLPSRLKTVTPARFESSWNEGLSQVLARLAALGLKPDLEPDQGRRIALRDYLPTRVTVAKPEPVFANVFPLHLPASMLIYDLTRALSEAEVADLRKQWAFVELHSHRLVAFTPPPQGAIPATKPGRTPEFAWADMPQKDGKDTENVAKELARRSLEVICVQKGLSYCADRQVFYFPERADGEWRQPYKHVDDRQTWARLTGMRTKGWGDRASQFLYQLAPKFYPQRDVDGTWNVVLNIYVRCTDLEGKVYERKEMGRRRKAVTKSWWNKDWLARMLAIVQALQTEEGRLRVGEGNRALVMDASPLRWECPVGLDVQALAGIPDLGEELAEFRAGDGADDEDDGTPAEVEASAQ
jgi:hypothetical protein